MLLKPPQLSLANTERIALKHVSLLLSIIISSAGRRRGGGVIADIPNNVLWRISIYPASHTVST